MHVHSGSVQHLNPSEPRRVSGGKRELLVEIQDPRLVPDEREEARRGVEADRQLPPLRGPVVDRGRHGLLEKQRCAFHNVYLVRAVCCRIGDSDDLKSDINCGCHGDDVSGDDVMMIMWSLELCDFD